MAVLVVLMLILSMVAHSRVNLKVIFKKNYLISVRHARCCHGDLDADLRMPKG